MMRLLLPAYIVFETDAPGWWPQTGNRVIITLTPVSRRRVQLDTEWILARKLRR